MKAPPLKIIPLKFAPEEIASYEIPPYGIPSQLTNHTNESKIKNTKFFTLKKAIQYSSLMKITKVLFDNQMISQKILGLDTFSTE